jgi:ATP-binding cassette subfamily B protein
MTLGQFVAFTAYQVMLGVPMVAFGSLSNTLQRGMASWRRMLEVFDEPEARSADAPPLGPGDGVEKAAPRIVPLIGPGRLEVKNLTFSYGPGSAPVLQDVSFAAEPGQTVAIVGVTGSGKSTLLHLVPRLLEPPRDSVFIDGVDVRDVPLEVLRASIGFVPQEPYLFAETLAENIAFAAPASSRSNGGQPERTRREEPPSLMELLSGGFDLRGTGTHHLAPLQAEAVRRAAAIARLDRDVPDLQLGYETHLGERGLLLSGGQRQRTALARALVIGAPVLILDDAMSAVDTSTEAEILGGLRAERRTRTTLVVSNRFSSIRDADSIIVLDHGRIVERGRHDELVESGGLYATLYRKQLLKEALEVS